MMTELTIETITPYQIVPVASARISNFNGDGLYQAYRNFYWKVKGFSKLAGNWDGLGTSAPSTVAIDHALVTLVELYNNKLLPDFVNPTSDDSIIIQLHKGDCFFLFEFFNDGDIVFLRKENGKRDVVDLQKWEIQNVIAQIPTDETNDVR